MSTSHLLPLQLSIVPSAFAIYINKANKTTQASTEICHLENYEISTEAAPEETLSSKWKIIWCVFGEPRMMMPSRVGKPTNSKKSQTNI